jgi:ATP-binding cassette, subfamily C (CFTR/MRP), member 1
MTQYYTRLKYETAIEAASLIQDLDEFPAYDETEIGEKGLNVSGGQKARLGIARAVYSDADVIILDDVLAALDSIVARRVFEQCVVGLLGGKTRLLVTHNDDLLTHSAVDVVITMTNGNMSIEYRHGTTHEATVSADPDVGVGDGVGTVMARSNSIMRRAFPLSGRYQPRPNSSIIANDATAAIDNTTTTTSSSTSLTPLPLQKNYSFVDRTNSDTNGASGKLNSAEDRATGRIDRKVYLAYMAALGGIKVLLFLVVVQSCWQTLSVGSDLFLSSWSREDDVKQAENLRYNVAMYSILSLSSGSIVLVRTLTISTIGYRAAKSMFESMLRSLMHAPMNWLDKNPSGRILNRMSDDQSKLDNDLPFAVGSIFATLFSFCGDLLTVMAITRYLIIVIIPIAYVYLKVTAFYLKASREVQRLQSVSQSPVLTFMSECSEGVYIIRAFGLRCIHDMITKNERLIDENSKIAFLASVSSTWFVLRIQVIGVFILLFIGLYVPGLSDTWSSRAVYLVRPKHIKRPHITSLSILLVRER